MIITTEQVVDVIGFSAGLSFVFSLAFQLVKIIKTKSAKDLSIFWSVFAFYAVMGTLILGLYYNLWPIMVANSMQAVLSFSIIILKIYYDRRDKINNMKTVDLPI